MSNENIVQKIWNLCHILRGDGISYHEYISELTYLLFLKIAEENHTESLLPEEYRWKRLIEYKGKDLLTEYRDILTFLGGHAENKIVREIYAFPTTVFSNSENLKAVIDGISKIDWHSISSDGMGEIYEGLLAKNSQDARSGAGQYFTPRALVDSIVRLVKPTTGEVIQDPAMGSGGFLISADHYVRSSVSNNLYNKNPPIYEGVEIEKGTYRICLMNAFLHQLKSNLILGDALTNDAERLAEADLILANPPFGAKGGSFRKQREDLIHITTNKQLAFLQHIYSGLKIGGRAAVILPDNVLFEEGVGKMIRKDLLEKCNLHTILRLPVGIFYSPGVKTNVLFFKREQSSVNSTKTVWVYDMRSNSVKFGKKRPLQENDFKDFEKFYGNDNNLSARVDAGETSRWRSFDREYISDRDENLDITWLPNYEDDIEESFNDPADIINRISLILMDSLNEIKELTEEFEIEEKLND